MEVDLSIREVAEATGLTAHTLRYYERIGLLSSIGRDAGGRRRFTRRDLEWIAFLQRLRALGMPIVEMCEYAALRRDGDSTAAARRSLLQKHLDRVRQEILLLEDSARLLEGKIVYYRALEGALSHSNPSEKETGNDDGKNGGNDGSTVSTRACETPGD